MNRLLTAGAIASELLLVANPAEARSRHAHMEAGQPAQTIVCDDRGCLASTTEPSAAPVDNTLGATGFGDSVVNVAQSQLGHGAIYGRRSLWCGRFMNWALARAGYRGTGSDLALSFLRLPRTSPHVGAIAVLGRGGHSGHVGIVSGFDAAGNPVIISGNHGHRVGRGVYSRRRVLAYVSPR